MLSHLHHPTHGVPLFEREIESSFFTMVDGGLWRSSYHSEANISNASLAILEFISLKVLYVLVPQSYDLSGIRVLSRPQLSYLLTDTLYPSPWNSASDPASVFVETYAFIHTSVRRAKLFAAETMDTLGL